jgi:transposase
MLSTRPIVGSHKQIKLLPEEHIGIGIDAHKRTFAVCLWSVEYDREVKRWTQPSDCAALMRKLEPLRDKVRQIAYEAGPTGFVLARALAADQWPVIVTSPADIPTSRNAPKSDKKDARRLARLASKNMLSRCWVPTTEHEDERRLVRMRGRVVADKNRAQLRIKSLLLSSGIAEPAGLRHWSKAGIEQLRTLKCSDDTRFYLNVCLEQLDHARRLLRSCDAQLVKVAQRPHNGKDVSILTRIPGVAAPSCIQFMVEMGTGARFQSRVEVSKYQGLAPEVRSSGESRSEMDLNNSGNRRLRTMLIEAAWRWIRYDENARHLYGRMMHNTGCSQKAIAATARKLGIIMWHLRETGKIYDTNKVSKKEPPNTQE